VLDDPGLSDRARSFLTRHATRHHQMDEAAVRASAVIRADGREEPAPDELVETLVWFEERYGGLFYPVLGSNEMEYGLDGGVAFHHTPLGPAFTGILDGGRTWGVDVLLDGSTAMDLGSWPYRVIDRSIDQRIEKHALLVEVRDWWHRTYTCSTPPHVSPVADERPLPPAVPEASGPADLWWRDDDTAVQATLHRWGWGRDSWVVRHFVRTVHLAAEADPLVHAAMGHETVPATWCVLCSATSPQASPACAAVELFSARVTVRRNTDLADEQVRQRRSPPSTCPPLRT
jgi:hypothetical protein